MKITEYTHDDLVRICSWLLSDQLQRDRDDRIREAMSELGFRKRGSVIAQRLAEALDVAQQHADRKAT